MILRSQHKLSKTVDGHEAWRSQSMPVVHRRVLTRLREPMTVHELMDRLPDMDRSEITESIAALASRGWVLVEDPPLRVEPVDELGLEDGAPPPVDALTDLMSRRPTAPLDPVADLESGVSNGPVAESGPEVKDTPRVVVPTGPVSDRGTPEQERALLIAMGLLSPSAPYHGEVSASAFDRVEDVLEEEEDLPRGPTSPDEASGLRAQPVLPGESKPMDPRRAEVLRRMEMATAAHRETRQALRENKARLAAEQAAADEQARRNREAEEAERLNRKR